MCNLVIEFTAFEALFIVDVPASLHTYLLDCAVLCSGLTVFSSLVQHACQPGLTLGISSPRQTQLDLRAILWCTFPFLVFVVSVTSVRAPKSCCLHVTCVSHPAAYANSSPPRKFCQRASIYSSSSSPSSFLPQLCKFYPPTPHTFHDNLLLISVFLKLCLLA